MAVFPILTFHLPSDIVDPHGIPHVDHFQKGMFYMQGGVKWFNADKGYGFIEREGGEDVFVHYSAMQEGGLQAVSGGQVVEFDMGEGALRTQGASVVKRGGGPSERNGDELRTKPPLGRRGWFCVRIKRN